MTPAKAQQAADIAGRFKALANTFSGQAEKIEFGRIYVEHLRKKCLFCYAFKSHAADFEMSVEGSNDRMTETLTLSQKLFSLANRQVKEIEKKYGRNHLRFNIY